MAMKVTLSTLPEPEIPIPGTFSHVVTIGDRLAIDVLDTTSPEAVSKWLRLLRRDTRRHKAAELVVGVETYSSKSFFVENNRRIHLIVLCVGSACLFYHNRDDSPFAKSSRGRSSGESVAKDLREFCTGSGVKLIGRGMAGAAKRLSDCGVEFGQAPLELHPLVERLLKRPVTKAENLDAVTTALWGDQVELVKVNEGPDANWDDGEHICNFVFRAYLASEIGRKILL